MTITGDCFPTDALQLDAVSNRLSNGENLVLIQGVLNSHETARRVRSHGRAGHNY